MAWNSNNTAQPLGKLNYGTYSINASGNRTARTGDPSDPSTFATGYLRPGLNTAQSYLNQGVGFNPYTGNRVASFSGDQNRYFSDVRGSLGSTPGYMGAAQGTVQDMAGGGATNPYFQGALNQQLDDIQNRVNAATSGMGRYGSGAHTSVLASELSDAATRALNENYFSEQGLKLNAAALAPQMQNAEIMRLNELLKSGTIQQAQQQDSINAARDLWEEKQQAPWNRLNAYMGAIGQPQSGSVQPQQQGVGFDDGGSRVQNVLGGAMTGASIGGMFGQPLLGGLAGGAFGLFG